MTKYAGLWIDHRQATIVRLLDEGEEIKHIESNMEKHVRYSGASNPEAPTGHTDAAEDTRDRRYNDHLGKYFDEVIAVLRDVDSILIFGPGEAKGEFRKRLESQQPDRHFISVEAADKMTDGQIATEIRRHFHHRAPAK